MAAGAKVFVPQGRARSSVNASTTQSGAFFNSNLSIFIDNVGTVRSAGTATNLYLRVVSNDRGASTFKLRVNGANGNLSISIGASTTGEFTDTSNSDAIAAGDEVNQQLITGSGGSSFIHSTGGWVYAATDNTVQRVGSTDHNNVSTASETLFYSIGGRMAIGAATESDQVNDVLVTSTAKNFGCRVNTNARASSSTEVGLRVAGADSSCKITAAASTTGVMEETSGTASLTIGDDICFYTRTGAGTGNFNVTGIWVELESTDGAWQIMNAQSGAHSETYSANTTYYQPIGGLLSNDYSTESETKVDAQVSFVASKFEANVGSNSVTASSVFRLRINGANSTQTFSVASSTTGVFQDTSHTDAIALNDELNYSIVVGATGTSLRVSGFSLRADATPQTVTLTVATADATANDNSVTLGGLVVTLNVAASQQMGADGTNLTVTADLNVDLTSAAADAEANDLTVDTASPQTVGLAAAAADAVAPNLTVSLGGLIVTLTAASAKADGVAESVVNLTVVTDLNVALTPAVSDAVANDIGTQSSAPQTVSLSAAAAAAVALDTAVQTATPSIQVLYQRFTLPAASTTPIVRSHSGGLVPVGMEVRAWGGGSGGGTGLKTGPIRRSIGVCDGVRSFVRASELNDNGVTPNCAMKANTNAVVLEIDESANAERGRVVFTSWDASNFTLTPATALDFAMEVEVILYFRCSFYVDAFTTPAGSTPFTRTGIPFTPSVGKCYHAATGSAMGTLGQRANDSYGVFTSAAQWCSYTAREEGSPSNYTFDLFREGCVGLFDAALGGAFNDEIVFSAFTADGGTFTRTGGASRPMCVVWIAGCDAKVGTVVARTSAQGAGSIDVPTPGFNAKLLDFCANPPATASESASAEPAEGIRGIATALDQSTVWLYDTNNEPLNPGVTDPLLRHDAGYVLRRWLRTGTDTLDGIPTAEIAVSNIAAGDKAVLSQTRQDVAFIIGYLALGDAATGATTLSSAVAGAVAPDLTVIATGQPPPIWFSNLRRSPRFAITPRHVPPPRRYGLRTVAPSLGFPLLPTAETIALSPAIADAIATPITVPGGTIIALGPAIAQAASQGLAVALGPLTTILAPAIAQAVSNGILATVGGLVISLDPAVADAFGIDVTAVLASLVQLQAAIADAVALGISPVEAGAIVLAPAAADAVALDVVPSSALTTVLVPAIAVTNAWPGLASTDLNVVIGGLINVLTPAAAAAQALDLVSAQGQTVNLGEAIALAIAPDTSTVLGKVTTVLQSAAALGTALGINVIGGAGGPVVSLGLKVRGRIYPLLTVRGVIRILG